VNIDGGAAHDPETGMLYVAALSGLSTTTLIKDPCSEFRYSSPRDNCGLIGALPAPEGYQPAPGGRGGGFGGRAGASMIGGISILKPKELGGVTAYDMNTGDKRWWIPNGGMIPVTSNDPLFAGVTLPPRAAMAGAGADHETLVIYGTGRGGGVPAPRSSSRWTRPPAGGRRADDSAHDRGADDVLHQGTQYIVFATGAGATTSLIALRLPQAAGREAGRQAGQTDRRSRFGNAVWVRLQCGCGCCR
jgi:quinoprotein glucose dehydrogenase